MLTPSSSPQVVLNAAPLLTPHDVQAVAFGLCSAQPRKAQLLLQEAVEKRRACAKQTGGSLVLVLDKVRPLLLLHLLLALLPSSCSRLPPPLPPSTCRSCPGRAWRA